uniref:Neutral ceramidase n=1 Tax=Lygus hesperus TaxID=30085 RepID=A0A0A9X4F0_LYGHE
MIYTTQSDINKKYGEHAADDIRNETCSTNIGDVHNNILHCVNEQSAVDHDTFTAGNNKEEHSSAYTGENVNEDVAVLAVDDSNSQNAESNGNVSVHDDVHICSINSETPLDHALDKASNGNDEVQFE